MNLLYTKKQRLTHKKFSSQELIITIYIHSVRYISQTQVEIFGIKHTTAKQQDSLNHFRGIVSLQEPYEEIRVEKLDQQIDTIDWEKSFSDLSIEEIYLTDDRAWFEMNEE